MKRDELLNLSSRGSQSATTAGRHVASSLGLSHDAQG